MSQNGGDLCDELLEEACLEVEIAEEFKTLVDEECQEEENP